MTALQLLIPAAFVVFAWVAPLAADEANIAAERDAFREYYLKQFPTLQLDDFILGVYAIDEKLRAQHDAINEFPPYEFDLDEGKTLVEEPFADGSYLLDCLKHNGPALNAYPYVDVTSGRVVSLALAVNDCRERHGNKRLDYRAATLSKVLAHLAATYRGERRQVGLPATPHERLAYEQGREYFYTKRGRLNLSCADCHLANAGKHLREQTLAPLLGVINRYPVYGLNWGAFGTLHQRFVGCLEQVRADPEYPQSAPYRALEYFLAVMSGDIVLAGPGIHR